MNTRENILGFHKIMPFTMKVIHKKLRGSANYGPPCIGYVRPSIRLSHSAAPFSNRLNGQNVSLSSKHI